MCVNYVVYDVHVHRQPSC